MPTSVESGPLLCHETLVSRKSKKRNARSESRLLQSETVVSHYQFAPFFPAVSKIVRRVVTVEYWNVCAVLQWGSCHGGVNVARLRQNMSGEQCSRRYQLMWRRGKDASWIPSAEDSSAQRGSADPSERTVYSDFGM